MSEPKIIVWDIETAPNLVTLWNLWQQYAAPEAIQQERYIICGAWKQLGSREVNSVSVADFKKFDRDPTDDSSVVKALHKALSDADAIIAHNGDKYDIRFLNARALYHGCSPLPDFVQIDTLKIARKKFMLNSNKLDYLGDFLGLGRKIKTEYELWLDCIRGKRSAVNKMLRYNKQDVQLLEKVYNKLAPYVPAKLNLSLFTDKEIVCPLCGSDHYHLKGYNYTRRGVYQRARCVDCGHNFQLAAREKITSKVK